MAEAEPLQPIPLGDIAPAISTTAARLGGPASLILDVQRSAVVALPLAEVGRLELDLVSSGHFLVTFTVGRPTELPEFFGPPRRTQVLRPGPATVKADLLTTAAWRPDGQPVLLFEGTGRVALQALRVAPVRAGPEAVEALDRAWRWAPESRGHTSVNFLTPPWWSISRSLTTPDVLGPAALVGALAILLALRAWGRRWRPGLALAVAALLATAAFDLHTLARFLPVAAEVPLQLDPEARLRDDLRLATALGPLVDLARRTLPEGARVGAVGDPADWYGPQTVCFHLFPRPCVLLTPGAASGRGIMGVGELPVAELDAVVVVNLLGALPPGFQRAASLSDAAYVATRR